MTTEPIITTRKIIIKIIKLEKEVVPIGLIIIKQKEGKERKK